MRELFLLSDIICPETNPQKKGERDSHFILTPETLGVGLQHSLEDRGNKPCTYFLSAAGTANTSFVSAAS